MPSLQRTHKEMNKRRRDKISHKQSEHTVFTACIVNCAYEIDIDISRGEIIVYVYFHMY